MPAPKITIRPNSPSSARRWRKKRIRAYDHWLRTLNWRPASRVPSTAPWGASTSPSIACVAGATESAWAGGRGDEGRLDSVIADARIEEAVGDVRDQVEDHDYDRGD